MTASSTPMAGSDVGHTAGPWETRRAVQPDNTGGYDVAVIDPGKAIIAECFEHVGYMDDGEAFDTRPAMANARLIAAAPELLHAALLALELIEHIQNEEGHSASTAIPAQALRAAIAKATANPIDTLPLGEGHE